MTCIRLVREAAAPALVVGLAFVAALTAKLLWLDALIFIAGWGRPAGYGPDGRVYLLVAVPNNLSPSVVPLIDWLVFWTVFAGVCGAGWLIAHRLREAHGE